MKALLYKEFKLAMHPICYLFIIFFPIMILIPSYPLAIGFIYVLTCYPILFLGANKGQQSNDLLYSTLLPVRKKDIVLARIITVIFMQLVFIIIMTCLYPVALSIRANLNQEAINAGKDIPSDVGFGLGAYTSTLAFVIIGYAVADLIYFAIYYKNGKSIVASTLLMILGFIAYLAVFTLGLPYIPAYKDFFTNNIWIQIGFLVLAILISFLLHVVVYKVSSKELERVDF